jgi:hypothetical protein
MKLDRIEHMVRGWFVGAFEPTMHGTPHVEVGYRMHEPGIRDWHYHTHVKEINLLVSGSMIIQGKQLHAGDIFVLEPYEVTDPEFLEPCGIVCVKFPSQNDKQSIPTPHS